MKRKYAKDTPSPPSAPHAPPAPPAQDIAKELYFVSSEAPPSKKPTLPHPVPSSEEVFGHFQPDLFTPESVQAYQAAYHASTPYRHGVIPSLLSDSLLRDLRDEVQTHVTFARKETDIYRVEQSGDLANLSGLPTEQLARLPNLARVRDALYSAEFRGFLETVSGAGKLSGEKIDMAISIYRPGGYLLCHDDVITSRRLSFILYLTDPEVGWRPEWGGGLRLFDTEQRTSAAGQMVSVPRPEHVKVIPPSWGQLCFFAVDPGKSFHDVEEVYHPHKGQEEEEGKAGKRIRMAISGWYHIPQLGEDGYATSLDQAHVLPSTRKLLQHTEAGEFEEPRPHFQRFHNADSRRSGTEVASNEAKASVEDEEGGNDDTTLTEDDLTFLLGYISPLYLTPDITEQICSSFEENSFIQIDRFLCAKFANKLRQFIIREQKSPPPPAAVKVENESPQQPWGMEWQPAGPPYKQRFLFQIPNHPPPTFSIQQQQRPLSASPASPPAPAPPAVAISPISDLLGNLFPSHPFRKWLSLITGLEIKATAAFIDVVARRFRHGMDYALGTEYRGLNPRLEFTLGCTVAGEWGRQQHEVEQEEQEEEAEEEEKGGDGENGLVTSTDEREEGLMDHGGQEIYMVDHRSPLPKLCKNNSRTDPTIQKAKIRRRSTPESKAPLSLNHSLHHHHHHHQDSSIVDHHPDDQPSSDSKAQAEKVDQADKDGDEDGEEYEEADDDDDEEILFAESPPHFNQLSLILRDAKSTMRMVKYISRAAGADRWDIKGAVEGVAGFGDGMSSPFSHTDSHGSDCGGHGHGT